MQLEYSGFAVNCQTKYPAEGDFFCLNFVIYARNFHSICVKCSVTGHASVWCPKRKSGKTKRHRNCFCAASLCFVLLWMRKKENRLLASEFKDIGKILRKQEKNDYRSMKFLLSPDRAPRIYPLYRGKTDDTPPSAVRRLAFADTPVPPVRQRLRAAPAPQMRCLHPAVP